MVVTTATGWGTGTLSFTAGQIAQSSSVDFNNGTITSAILTADNSTNLVFRMTANGGNTNLIDNSDALTTWATTYGITPTINTSTKVQGTGAINGGTTTTNQPYFGYSRASFVGGGR